MNYGLLQSLGAQPDQEQPTGLLGSLGSPEKMAYLAMIAKGMNPWSSLDPEAMLKLAASKQDRDLQRRMQLMQMGISQGHLDLARQQANEPKLMVRPDGSIVAVPKGFTGTEGGAQPNVVVPGVKNLEETAAQKDYNLAKSQGFEGTFADFQQKMKEAGVPEKAYDAAVGGGYAKDFLKIQEDSRNATAQIAQLDQMKKLIPNFRSGTGAGYEYAARKLGVLFGGDEKAAASTEQFRALANKAVMDEAGGLGRQISDADRNYIDQTVPNISNTAEGNKQIIDVKIKLQQRRQQVAQLARDYAKSHGNRIDAGFDDVLQKFVDSNPLFPEAQPAGGAGASGGVVDWQTYFGKR